jgi:hypothetical protein
MWLRSWDLSRRAVLKLGPVGESVSNRSRWLAISSARGKWFFYFPLSFELVSERYMEPNDDKPPSSEVNGVEVPAVIR